MLIQILGRAGLPVTNVRIPKPQCPRLDTGICFRSKLSRGALLLSDSRLTDPGAVGQEKDTGGEGDLGGEGDQALGSVALSRFAQVLSVVLCVEEL